MRPFGVTKTPEGLRFAHVSGIEGHVKSSDEISYTKSELKYVEEQYMISSDRDEDEGLVDVLFTWSWPQEIKKTSFSVPESNLIGPLIWNLKPRYIFAPSHDHFDHFERKPYENVDMKSGEFFHSTRFIALASAKDSNDREMKKKWIYALNLIPGKFLTPLSLAKRPDDCTSNPFSPIASSDSKGESSSMTESSAPNYFFQVSGDLGSKRRYDHDISAAQLKRPPSGYVCKKCHGSDHFFRDCIYKDSNLNSNSKTYVCHICHEPGHLIRNCPKRDERTDRATDEKSRAVAPGSCWFCLSNPAAQKHLIVDIGEEVYLALAKGPLTPEHVIIVPIEHISSTASDFDLVMKEELEKFMRKVSESHEGKQSIFFRMSSNPSHHYHLQSVSVDSGKLQSFLEFLEDFSIKLGYNFKESGSGDSLINGSFFEFSYINSGGKIIRLAHTYDPSAFFPAQYGRQVLANFLNIEGGADWKKQLYTEEDEKIFVSHLKNSKK